MIKENLVAASLALLLAGPALAADTAKRTTIVPNRASPAEDRDDRDWRDHDRRHGHDWDRNDWRRDDEWRRRGWYYHGGRNDGWRYYRGHDNRHWRYVPPSRYSLDFGYRSGYELAWRDWQNHGRHDRHWRRSSIYGYGVGHTYHSGYDAGWRDAAYYYGRGYRPDYWDYDPHGGWYFGFRFDD